MAIKPIENNNRIMVYKTLFIFFLIIAGLILAQKINSKNQSKEKILGSDIYNQIQSQTKELVNQTGKTTQDLVGNILGETTSLVKETASRSAEVVGDYLFQNTFGGLIKQIDKLPESQQKRIKEYLCQ